MQLSSQCGFLHVARHLSACADASSWGSDDLYKQEAMEVGCSQRCAFPTTDLEAKVNECVVGEHLGTARLPRDLFACLLVYLFTCSSFFISDLNEVQHHVFLRRRYRTLVFVLLRPKRHKADKYSVHPVCFFQSP